MIPRLELDLLSICLEGFLYGLYSGIFAIYLQSPSHKTRTANVIFYVFSLLYVLSAAVFVGDMLNCIVGWHISTLAPQLQIDLLQEQNRISDLQATVDSSSDFISQCILIYRCWIVWGKNIRFVILPSFLAITSFATWLVVAFADGFHSSSISLNDWGQNMMITSMAASMAVNTLVTGLIVFRILKVFLEIKPTSVKRTLGSTRDTKYQHIMFIIIESGMALFVIQLVSIVLASIQVPEAQQPIVQVTYNFVVVINQMLNGIAPTIILVRVSMGLSFDDEGSFKEATETLRFNNPPTSDLDTRQQIGRSSSILPQDSDSSR